MFQLAERIARDTMERLSRLTTAHLPALLAALFILLVAWMSVSAMPAGRTKGSLENDVESTSPLVGLSQYPLPW